MGKWKKGMLLLLSCLLVFGMTGCNSIKLTEEENDKIAEYIAGKLLEYDRHYEESIIYAEEEPETPVESEEPQTPEQTELPVASEEPSEEPETPVTSEVPPVSEGAIEVPKLQLAQLYQEEQIQVSYQGYQLYQEYPEKVEENAFVVEASFGKQLLVLFFELENVKQEKNELSLIGKDYSFALQGEEGSQKPLMTFLLNDLQYYEASLAEGEKKEVILVFEAGEDFSPEMYQLEFKKGEESGSISIK